VESEWGNRKLRKKGNTEKVRGHAVDVGLTARSSDVTIYTYVGTVLGRLPKNSASRNTSERGKNDGHIGKWLDDSHQQRNAKQA
jgi:hypothetical protein